MDAGQIENSARGMIKNFGADALMNSEKQAQRYARCHDQVGAATWRAIALAVSRIADIPNPRVAESSFQLSGPSRFRHEQSE